MGRLADSRVFKADVNPIDIEYWTVVWVQLPRLGGKAVPIWITKDIGNKWRSLQDVQLFAYYFKNFHYRTLNDIEKFTPLFVAADMQPVALPTSPLNSLLSYTFMAATLLMMIIVLVMYRTNMKQGRRHEVELVERRRRRRTREMQEAGGQT